MDPDEFDPMFLDGFTTRHAFEVVEVLTQSSQKKKDIGGAYQKFMTEARTVNAIEQGPVEQAEDAYLALRR